MGKSEIRFYEGTVGLVVDQITVFEQALQDGTQTDQQLSVLVLNIASVLKNVRDKKEDRNKCEGYEQQLLKGLKAVEQQICAFEHFSNGNLYIRVLCKNIRLILNDRRHYRNRHIRFKSDHNKPEHRNKVIESERLKEKEVSKDAVYKAGSGWVPINTTNNLQPPRFIRHNNYHPNTKSIPQQHFTALAPRLLYKSSDKKQENPLHGQQSNIKKSQGRNNLNDLGTEKDLIEFPDEVPPVPKPVAISVPPAPAAAATSAPVPIATNAKTNVLNNNEDLPKKDQNNKMIMYNTKNEFTSDLADLLHGVLTEEGYDEVYIKVVVTDPEKMKEVEKLLREEINTLLRNGSHARQLQNFIPSIAGAKDISREDLMNVVKVLKDRRLPTEPGHSRPFQPEVSKELTKKITAVSTALKNPQAVQVPLANNVNLPTGVPPRNNDLPSDKLLEEYNAYKAACMQKHLDLVSKLDNQEPQQQPQPATLTEVKVPTEVYDNPNAPVYTSRRTATEYPVESVDRRAPFHSHVFDYSQNNNKSLAPFQQEQQSLRSQGRQQSSYYPQYQPQGPTANVFYNHHNWPGGQRGQGQGQGHGPAHYGIGQYCGGMRSYGSSHSRDNSNNCDRNIDSNESGDFYVQTGYGNATGKRVRWE